MNKLAKIGIVLVGYICAVTGNSQAAVSCAKFFSRAEEHQNKGIAKAIMKELFQLGKSLGSVIA